jgi:hypothetical protein
VARATANKLYRTFTKGLITEAGYLTYPENASTDELNTVIKVKGSRSRRLGIDFEPSSAALTVSSFTSSSTTNEYGWHNVGEDSSVNFLVCQIGSTLHFFNMDATPATKKGFTVDLTSFKVDTASATMVANEVCQFASGKGFLFVVHPYTEPVVVEYDDNTDTITATQILVQIRDFDGVNDGLGNEEQPTTLTKEHLYNLKNQGWAPGYTQVTSGGGGSLETGEQGYVNPYTGARGAYNTSIP